MKTFYFFLCFLFFLSASPLLAQDDFDIVEDPLKKPKIWEALKNSPDNNKLWCQYVGKKWAELSLAEKEDINIMKQNLLLSMLDAESALVIEADAEPGEGDEEILDFTSVSANEVDNAEKMINYEAYAEIADLRDNVEENFVILEDLYKELFTEYSSKYIYYKEKYPDGDYSKVKWIEEQEAILGRFRMERLEKLRARLGK